jgi:hypothetical protein
MEILKLDVYEEGKERIIGNVTYKKSFFKATAKGWFGKLEYYRIIYNSIEPVECNNTNEVEYNWYVVELGRSLRRNEIRQCQWLLMENRKENNDA